MNIDTYSNQDNAKIFKTQRNYLPKSIIIKNFHDQFYDQHEEIRKLTTVLGEDYTTGCLLGYDYIRKHYRLIAIDLSKQKNQMLIQKQFNKQNLLDN